MAVSEQTPYIEYTANGITTSFALEFDCGNQDHLIVLVDDVEPAVGSWSLTGGAVVFGTAPEDGKKITIQRNTPFSRNTDYQSYNNSFRPQSVNGDFDRVWCKIQELGVRDWLLDLKIQKFRNDVNLTALENTLEEAKQIRDDTADSVIEVQSNVAQSHSLLTDTTNQANLAQGYASSANSANAAAQQAVIDVSTAEANVYSALSAQQIAVNNSLTAIAGGHKAYATLAAALANTSTLPQNSIVEITNDSDSSKNGTYQWNGADLTKSAYDPLTQAKTYADLNKLDLSKINFTYLNGNKIGPKSRKYVSFGVTSALALSSGNYYDSCVTGVMEGETLYLFNDKKVYSPADGGAYAFYAENPYTNKTQARITDNRAVLVDTASGLSHVKVTVPVGAKYLIVNTRYTNAAGTVNTTFQWAVHSGAFNSSYVPGNEAVSAINEIPLGGFGDYAKSVVYVDTQLGGFNKLKVSTKNMLNPETVVNKEYYNNLGVIQRNQTSNYSRTIKYAVQSGAYITLSNISGMTRRTLASLSNIQFWNSDTFVSLLNLPEAKSTNIFTFLVPEGVTHFSFNLTESLPTRLQIEVGDKATTYEPYYLNNISPEDIEFISLKRSSKNLWDGLFNTSTFFNANGVVISSSNNDVLSSFIPVEYAKYYTVSGLDASKVIANSQQIFGYSSNFSLTANKVKQVSQTGLTDKVTVYIDDPAIKFILVQLVSKENGLYEDASKLLFQVEEGQVKTNYEPPYFNERTLNLVNNVLKGTTPDADVVKAKSVLASEFIELNKVRDAASTTSPILKDIAPFGVMYAVQGDSQTINASNNLYTKVEFSEASTKAMHINLMTRLNSEPALGKLNLKLFDIPSGALDNEGSLTGYKDAYSAANYCHPNIEYSDTPVAGFKYWMISSTLPANASGALWEDEDLFVSNDAKNWQRVRSLYESDKSYTTATLRLPPHTLVTNNARKYAFLPCPSAGDTIEISVPSDNGGAALERVNITLTGLPWKHDPTLLIDGGYVYTYHSFHLSYADRPSGKNRFIVCVRTNNGVDWDVVRTDGSTMRLTEASSRQIFTKDDQGRYNYMAYFYDRPYSNPEIIKWGESDYEFYYSENLQIRYKGSTPYSFNLATSYPVGSTRSPNHPDIFKYGDTLYFVNNKDVYKSMDRGQTLTKLGNYPMWLGGVNGMAYKKSLTVGEGGKLILAEAQRFFMPAMAKANVNNFTATNDVHHLFLSEFSSVAEFESLATNGLVDAYADVQLCKVNFNTKKREYLVIPALSLKTLTPYHFNRDLQRLKLCDMTFVEGDTLHIYVTLNSRKGGRVEFGGIDIA